jgi:hypothetical protein
VTGETVLFEHRNNLTREVNLGISLKRGDGKSGVGQDWTEGEEDQSHGVMVRVRSEEYAE